MIATPDDVEERSMNKGTKISVPFAYAHETFSVNCSKKLRPKDANYIAKEWIHVKFKAIKMQAKANTRISIYEAVLPLKQGRK